jgi:S1-C subfamily serine protease
MKKYKFSGVILLSLLSLLISLLMISFGDNRDGSKTIDRVTLSQILKQLPIENIYKQAQVISVKIVSKEGFLGSGTLFQKQGKTYKIITNAHVLRAGSIPYQVETNDGRIHRAKIIKNNKFGELDIAILEFVSLEKVYVVPLLGISPKLGDEVFTCGFPEVEEGAEKPKFLMTKGKVSLILPQPLKEGYQIGHTNNIESGMSGGALLNSQGELIGIGGKQAYPAWDILSKFIDGSDVPLDIHKKIVALSWSVSIESVEKMQSLKQTEPVLQPSIIKK